MGDRKGGRENRREEGSNAPWDKFLSGVGLAANFAAQLIA